MLKEEIAKACYVIMYRAAPRVLYLSATMSVTHQLCYNLIQINIEWPNMAPVGRIKTANQSESRYEDSDQ